MHGGSNRNAAEDRESMVQSRFFVPPDEFDGCFTTFYRLTLNVEDGVEISDQLQPEWGTIRFFSGSAPKAVIGSSVLAGAHFGASGPSSLPTHFSIGSARMWGIGFLPLGWARFIDVNAREMANVVVNGHEHPAFAKFTGLAEVLCDASCSEEEQFDALVATMRDLARPHRDEETIVRIHHALMDEGLVSVSALADRAELSIRTLERICVRHFGFTPKLLMQRQRFMRSLTSFMLDGGSKWTEVIDDHYHDQAQFSREFRTFMGMSPTQYMAMDHPVIASIMEARARMWGSAAQTLDRPA